MTQSWATSMAAINLAMASQHRFERGQSLLGLVAGDVCRIVDAAKMFRSFLQTAIDNAAQSGRRRALGHPIMGPAQLAMRGRKER